MPAARPTYKYDMKLRYVILLCASILGVVVCICLLFAYHNLPEDDGEALESLRDVIKEFETLPPELADTDPADTVSPSVGETETVPPPETEAESTTVGGSASETSSVGRPTTGSPATGKPQTDTPVPDTPAESTSADTSPDVTAAPAESDSETAVPETRPAETTADKPNRVPAASLNFEKLWKVNPDICAWLEITDTRIDYPVVQSPDDDKKYLNTAYNDSPYVGGALFTEATYNSTDFNDPVTVIYGHTMNSGMLFGDLQKNYSSAAGFAENGTVTLYLPGEVRQYTVFAAVPYERVHILHTYDFTNSYWYDRFFTEVGRIRAIGANFDRDSFPEAGDRVLILSVCLNEDTAKRYLVMAALDTDLADNADVTGE